MELHHILPVACGGTNDKTNLVLFPLKAHFLAHHLLKKIYYGTQYEIQMDNAFNLMCNTKTDFHTGKNYGVRTTMRVYENAKLDAAKHKSGDNNPAKRPDVRKKLSAKAKGRSSWNKGKKMPPKSKELRQRMSENSKNRVWITDGIKSWMVKQDDPRLQDPTYSRGRIVSKSETAVKNRSIAHKGKKQKHRKPATAEQIQKQAASLRQLIWVTNGEISLRVKPNKIPFGFYKGRLNKKEKCNIVNANIINIQQDETDNIFLDKKYIHTFIVCEKDGKIISKFKSLREAEKATKICRHKINKYAKNNTEINGIVWKFRVLLDTELCQKESDLIDLKYKDFTNPLQQFLNLK